MSDTTVSFHVRLLARHHGVGDDAALFLIGSAPELGAWDTAKAGTMGAFWASYTWWRGE